MAITFVTRPRDVRWLC